MTYGEMRRYNDLRHLTEFLPVSIMLSAEKAADFLPEEEQEYEWDL